MRKTSLPILIAIALTGVLTVSCDRTRNQKGYEYFPDMAHSLAYETYAPNKVFANGQTMQAPVQGTVPRELIPYQYAATPEGRLQAGKELVNPLSPDTVNLARGKAQFAIFCKGCHGDSGKGDGHLFTSGKFAVQPASLLSERMMAAPIGEVFHVISAGWNTMGAHGPQIPYNDRWCIAMYVKNVLQTNQK
jgi:mono/diheme cytochrome c family protein